MYKLNRLTFGIEVTSAIVQQIMDTMLSGLDFAVTYLDDILLKIENSEYKKNFRGFQKDSRLWIQTERRKMGFLMNKIKYLMQIIDKMAG